MLLAGNSLRATEHFERALALARAPLIARACSVRRRLRSSPLAIVAPWNTFAKR